MPIPLKRKAKLEILFISSLAVLVVIAAYPHGQATARESTSSSPASASSVGAVAPSADLVVIALDEAIRRAQANEPAYWGLGIALPNLRCFWSVRSTRTGEPQVWHSSQTTKTYMLLDGMSE
jgi:hypothetical protein